MAALSNCIYPMAINIDFDQYGKKYCDHIFFNCWIYNKIQSRSDAMRILHSCNLEKPSIQLLDSAGLKADVGQSQGLVRRSKFNIPWISFCYLASLSLRLAVQITSTMKLVINELSQLWVFQLQAHSYERGRVVNYKWHHQNHEWITSYV